VQFALPFSRSSITVFRHDSFGRDRRRAQLARRTVPGPPWRYPDRSFALAADPPRLAAGGAELDVATSDVLCRLVTACAKAPSFAFARLPPVFRQGHDQSRCQGPARHHLVRDAAGRGPRTPSVGSMPNLAVERGVLPVPVTFATSSSHPFAGPIDSASSRDEPRVCATPRALGLPRGSPRWSSGKMLLTDFCNRLTTRAPEHRSMTEHAAFTASTTQVLPDSPTWARGPS
jgi:hypothetical protein